MLFVECSVVVRTNTESDKATTPKPAITVHLQGVSSSSVVDRTFESLNKAKLGSGKDSHGCARRWSCSKSLHQLSAKQRVFVSDMGQI